MRLIGCGQAGRIAAILVISLAVTGPLAWAAGEDHSHAAAPAAEKRGFDYKPTTKAELRVESDVVDDAKSIVATVNRAGRPLPGLVVSFEVPRLFGTLVLGEAETRNDGRAVVPFPEGLPGDAKNGDILLTARVVRSNTYFGEANARIPGGKPLALVTDPFPREIWSPKTDWILLLTIPTLLGIVWTIYAYSIRLLFRIRRTQ